jgi:hypothetical protein
MARNYNLAFLSTAAAACVCVCVSSCNKEETPSEPARHTATLQASAAGDETTRSIFDAHGKFYWLPSDAIGLATENADGTTTFSELTLEKTSQIATSGVFSGKIEGSAGKYAVYPYNAAHKLSGTTLTYNLPASYDYDDLDADYFTSVTTSYINSANAPAYGVITTGDNGSLSTQFKHLGGVLCIKLDYIPATNGHITIIADRKITGDFSVNLKDATPQIKTSDDATSSTEDKVTINWAGVTQSSSGGVFYFPMPTGTFNVSVEVGYHSGNFGEMARVSKSREVTITRRLMKRVSLTYETMAKDSYYIYGGHKFIDLGLPSGLLWAETNVGADNCYASGGYYAWGETATKSEYVAPPSSYNKYNDDDDKTVLELTDDAAAVNWGTYVETKLVTYCRMPSMKDWQELHDNCKIGDDTNYYGRTYVSKKDGNTNSIFLIAGGFILGGTNYNDRYEPEGFYWSRNLGDVPDYPYAFIFSGTSDHTRIGFKDGKGNDYEDYRYKGFSIRPVVSIKEIGY